MGKSFYFFKVAIEISRVGQESRVSRVSGNAPIFKPTYTFVFQ